MQSASGLRQSDRDVPDMYRRLRVNSLRLEALGLQHISGPEAMRRSLLLQRDPHALNVLASVLEPVSFGERYESQRTNGYTTLDRLVDSVVADPPSRQTIAGEVYAIAPDVKVPDPTDPKQQADHSADVSAGTLLFPSIARNQLRRRFSPGRPSSPPSSKRSAARPA